MPLSGERLIIGTRGSLLARAQTQWVVDVLLAAHPGLQIDTRVISTAGDREQKTPLAEIGTKGLFTLELEQALLDGSVDLAVHSAKDLPSRLGAGLAVLGYPVREDPRDAWISAEGVAFQDVAPGSVVGTSSLRRQAQLLMRRPDLTFIALRGNVDTRIRKVQEGQCAGAVLAMAGLNRAGLAQHATHPFEPTVCLPAAGQGALALEGRAGDERVRRLVRPISDEATTVAVECERAILAELDAGCRAPVAIHAVVQEGSVYCQALVVDPLGQRWVQVEADFPVHNVNALVQRIISELRAGGAGAIIASARGDSHGPGG